MKYPTPKEVKKASVEQLALWYRELPAPGENWADYPHEEFRKHAKYEIKILSFITERLAKHTSNKGGLLSDRKGFTLEEEPEELEELP